MKKIRLAFVVLASLFAFFSFSCRSTHFEDRNVVQLNGDPGVDSEDSVFALYQNIDFAETLEDQKYIFIRLYQPYYDNPFCIENILNNCIKSVDVAEESSSHSAIAFSLDDAFYGLTSSNSGHNLFIESCTAPGKNEYMKKCNLKKSVEITYALKVTDEEYLKVKEAVEKYYNDPATVYDVEQNVKIAWHSVRRKVFTPQNKKAFAAVPDKNPEETFKEDRHSFVCSTFIAYILANNVESVGEYFREKNIDSNYVVPSDLEYLPGIKKLFKTTWVDYNKGARSYTKVYSCLAPYYHEYIVSE